MMWWDGGYGMGVAGIVWMIVMIAIVIAVVVGVVLLVRSLTGPRGQSDQPTRVAELPQREGGARASEALRVLEQRYARGEIGREEFLQKREDLLGQG